MVVGGGFEPPKALPTDLQSVPFGHSGTPPYDQLLTLEPAEGLEPPAHWLQISSSTNWATLADNTLKEQINHRARKLGTSMIDWNDVFYTHNLFFSREIWLMHPKNFYDLLFSEKCPVDLCQRVVFFERLQGRSEAFSAIGRL